MPQPRPFYQHRDFWIVLLVLGVILLAVGIGVASYCSADIFGFCVDHPYGGIGVATAIAGIVLLIFAILLLALKWSAASSVHPAFGGPPPLYPPPGYYPPQTPVPTFSSPAPAPADRYCPLCGGGNPRAAAFCQKCGQPLPPAP